MTPTRFRFRIAVQLVLCQMFYEISSQQCDGEYSIHGMMLKQHVYKTIKTSISLECLQACNEDVKCQSFNYVILKDLCELNNRTKEAKPEDYVPDSGRFYYGRVRKRVPVGSIPELPAESCKEIKSSEGRQAVSGNYWFDFLIPGKVILAHCDMETEDIDECVIDAHNCLKDLAHCFNTLGSYTCACKYSYYGDGKTRCLPLPAECLSYSELTNAERKVTARDARLCDVNSLVVPGWFRFQGDAGTKMPITCPEKYSCGTDAPGWLNGAHPTMAEGQVTRQVCFNWGSSCCQWTINIQVTNCYSYYVYYLSQPPICNLVYCGSD